MNNWNNLDLEVAQIRENIILLTEEFDKINGKGIEDYNKKLNRFLNTKLRNKSESILQKQLSFSLFYL